MQWDTIEDTEEDERILYRVVEADWGDLEETGSVCLSLELVWQVVVTDNVNQGNITFYLSHAL